MIPGDVGAEDAAALAAGAEAEHDDGIGQDLVEYLRGGVAHVQQVGVRPGAELRAVAVVVVEVHAHEALRFPDRGRLMQERPYEAEGGRVGADAERQARYRGHREPGTLDQLSDSEPQISRQIPQDDLLSFRCRVDEKRAGLADETTPVHIRFPFVAVTRG